MSKLKVPVTSESFNQVYQRMFKAHKNQTLYEDFRTVKCGITHLDDMQELKEEVALLKLRLAQLETQLIVNK